MWVGVARIIYRFGYPRNIEKLCKLGIHENIVSVLQHGKLSNSAFYFFDMKLCDFNLETYAQTL